VSGLIKIKNKKLFEKLIVKRISNNIKEEWMKEISRKTSTGASRYRDSIKIKLEGSKARIYADWNSKVPFYLEYGTIGHMIRPKKPGGTLHWRSNGKDYFSKGHFVCGIKPLNILGGTVFRVLRKL